MLDLALLVAPMFTVVSTVLLVFAPASSLTGSKALMNWPIGDGAIVSGTGLEATGDTEETGPTAPRLWLLLKRKDSDVIVIRKFVYFLNFCFIGFPHKKIRGKNN